MKVVLLEDIKTLGKKGDIVEASDGYAGNFLLPKKKAIAATPENLNTLKLQKANADKIAAELLAEAKELKDKIEKSEVTVSIKGGEGGKTYGSVSTKEIAQAMKEQSGLEVDKKKIALSEPIKTFGVHEISIKLHKEVSAKLKVKVVEE